LALVSQAQCLIHEATALKQAFYFFKFNRADVEDASSAKLRIWPLVWQKKQEVFYLKIYFQPIFNLKYLENTQRTLLNQFIVSKNT
jgi:hypothetical protein